MAFDEKDIAFMRRAMVLAERARDLGEVPVGAVIVQGDSIVGEGCNQPITRCDPSAHAEIMALRQAGAEQKNYRLPSTTLYVTLEPCAMCVGALVHARIERLVYAATEPKAGAVISQLQLLDAQHWNHLVKVEGGLLATECSSILSEFFKQRRAQAKLIKQQAVGGDTAS